METTVGEVGAVKGINGEVTGIKSNRTKKSTKVKKEIFVRYVVKCKGFLESYPTLDSARAQYDILKRRAIKGREKTRIQIFEKDEKGSKLLDEIRITESFFED